MFYCLCLDSFISSVLWIGQPGGKNGEIPKLDLGLVKWRGDYGFKLGNILQFCLPKGSADFVHKPNQ